MLHSSIDGKITRGKEQDASVWASKEDAGILFEQIADNNLIVMGRKTFEAARNRIKLDPQKLRVVLTRNPKHFQNLTRPGMLEFSNEEPTDLVKRLSTAGYERMLLFGGGQTAARFFKSSLVDELWLTVEPYVFGSGTPIVADEPLDVSLELFDLRRLNPRGTLHLRYEVIKQ